MATTSLRERLLSGLCVDLGFCLTPDDTAQLIAWQAPKVRAFTDALFEAERTEKPNDLRLWRQVRDRVAETCRQEAP
jgi:hypothetical protein